MYIGGGFPGGESPAISLSAQYMKTHSVPTLKLLDSHVAAYYSYAVFDYYPFLPPNLVCATILVFI